MIWVYCDFLPIMNMRPQELEKDESRSIGFKSILYKRRIDVPESSRISDHEQGESMITLKDLKIRNLIGE